MGFLNSLDYTIIVVYFCILIGIGLYLRKRASESMEDYFLGGRKLPWWALGASGMAAWLDITGTMIITSFLFMLGPRGLFIEFRGGAVLVLAVILLWGGKWHRRSGCMTNAEWMLYRFGNGFGGRFAQILSVIATIFFTIGALGYMVKGVGLFLAMFLPYSPTTCSVIMVSVATVYTLMSGFYGVVFTDIFQSGIILSCCIAAVSMAVAKLGGGVNLSEIAYEVTGNEQWTSSLCHWKTTMPAGYEAYSNLTLFAIFYLFRNVFAGMGSGGEPIYFAARSDRECGTLSFLRGTLITFRWPMMISFAILGLFMVKEIFPDQKVLVESAVLIKNHFPDINQSQWEAALSSIISQPDRVSDLAVELKGILGESWQQKVQLLSYHGNINPERILPAVIQNCMPAGLRGMILVALIAASMSTFDSMLNGALAYFTRDIYQDYIRPDAGRKELNFVNWAFGFFLVALGVLFGYSAKSINDVWGWLAMGLGGGLIIPLVLRFYWWRFNGVGFALGTLFGLISAILQRAFLPQMNEIFQFLLMIMVSLSGAIIGTFIGKPVKRQVLENFYKTTRPFGLWRNFKAILDPKVAEDMSKEHKNDILAIPFTLGWMITMFLLPMQLIVGSYKAFGITLCIFLICLSGMYFLWYKKLK
ncbi:MAG: sodium:solute symporter [Planctomycetota bacterium]|nr:MAG: sodium:solute symporter [Planctomycetota bacterium]